MDLKMHLESLALSGGVGACGVSGDGHHSEQSTAVCWAHLKEPSSL
jgi:hypothetical protein